MRECICSNLMRGWVAGFASQPQWPLISLESDCGCERFCAIHVQYSLSPYIYPFNEYYLRYHTLSPTQNCLSVCDKVTFTSSNGSPLELPLFLQVSHFSLLCYGHYAPVSFPRNFWNKTSEEKTEKKTTTKKTPKKCISGPSSETYFIIGCFVKHTNSVQVSQSVCKREWAGKQTSDEIAAKCSCKIWKSSEWTEDRESEWVSAFAW